jgi:type IV secretion system protein VirB9
MKREMKRFLMAGPALTLMLAAAGACSAAGAAMFNQQDGGGRVEQIPYSDNKVVKIGGIIDQPFLIEFRDDEPIEDVAGGTIAGWDVHKKGYRLFIRAREESKYTTLLVTTRKHSYVFDLIPKLSTPDNFEQRRSKIVFTYPTAADAGPQPPAYRNEAYSMQVVAEESDIRPREVYDDGRFTWFRFPKNMEVPVIYRSVPGTKDEMLVNYHVEGDYLVMHATAPLWNLRLAGSMVGVFNEGYDGQGVPPLNSTTVRGLAREGKQ